MPVHRAIVKPVYIMYMPDSDYCGQSSKDKVVQILSMNHKKRAFALYEKWREAESRIHRLTGT